LQVEPELTCFDQEKLHARLKAQAKATRAVFIAASTLWQSALPVSGMPNEGEKAGAGYWRRCASCAVSPLLMLPESELTTGKKVYIRHPLTHGEYGLGKSK
jgi:hypothetical protein